MLSSSPLLLVVASASTLLSSAFVAPTHQQLFASCTHDHLQQRAAASTPLFSTVIPGTETETEKKEKESWKEGEFEIPSDENEIRGPVEWLIDDVQVSRDDEEPFHILLLDETYAKNERITIEYVASSCAYVLAMPYDEAAELAAHAEKEGFSCLGTWSHAECTRLGTQLQNRDLVCRVVPFCEGGDRAWQARNAEEGADMKRAEDDGWN